MSDLSEDQRIADEIKSEIARIGTDTQGQLKARSSERADALCDDEDARGG
jgi:hypothetical protein